jgi:hypothetical protein
VQGFAVGSKVMRGRVRMFACNGVSRTYAFTYEGLDNAGNVSTTVCRFRVYLRPPQ